MRSQVDGLGLTGAGVLERRRRLLAHVEEDECEVSDEHDDTRYAVRQKRVLCSYITNRSTLLTGNNSLARELSDDPNPRVSKI